MEFIRTFFRNVVHTGDNSEAIEKLQFWCEKNEYVLNAREQEVSRSIGTKGAAFATMYGAATSALFYGVANKLIRVRFYSAPTLIRLLYGTVTTIGFFAGLEMGLAQMKHSMILNMLYEREPISNVMVDVLLQHPAKDYYISIFPDLESLKNDEAIQQMIQHKQNIRDKKYQAYLEETRKKQQMMDEKIRADAAASEIERVVFNDAPTFTTKSSKDN